MKIEHLFWTRVCVRYERSVARKGEPKRTEDTFKNAFVTFEGGALKIQSDYPKPDGASLLLTRPRILRMTPWGMEWEAFWWASALAAKRYRKLIKATVTVTF